ncbi:MAG: hypothetical protein OHK0053_23970 [Microscillaceae bacterium]
MKKQVVFLIILALSVSGHAVLAQLNMVGFHFKSPRKTRLEIPFELYNNLIVVPVRINELDTLNFVLDTGVGYTLITDPGVRQSLGLTCYRQVKVAGAGTEQELLGCVTNVRQIELEGIRAFNHNLIILEEDVLNLSRYAGIKIHGLLGFDIFSRFVVRINYVSQRVIFYHPENYQHRGRGEKIPIQIEHMKPYVVAEAELAAGHTQVKLVLDTGAGHSLSLDPGAHPNIQIPKIFVSSNLGMTLNGSVKGAIGRIHRFKLGSFEMEKVITAFPDSNSLNLIRQITERQGNVGCGVLRRFHLTFNYPQETLILKPNRLFKTPFEFNTSGIDLVADPPRYKTFRVGAIRTHSPAEEAGLRPGDVIVAIDQHVASQLRITQAYHLLNKKKNQTTSLLVQRNGKMLVFELMLQEPI